MSRVCHSHCIFPDYATGFGGKYGVQKDRVDQSAVGWDHQEKLAQHGSQTDQSTGFGGKFGVQGDRKDQVGNICSYLHFFLY